MCFVGIMSDRMYKNVQCAFFFPVKQDKRVKSWFWLFNLYNSEKHCKIGLHGGEIFWQNVFGIRPQCLILFGFGQEFSFRCIPTRNQPQSNCAFKLYLHPWFSHPKQRPVASIYSIFYFNNLKLPTQHCLIWLHVSRPHWKESTHLLTQIFWDDRLKGRPEMGNSGLH